MSNAEANRESGTDSDPELDSDHGAIAVLQDVGESTREAGPFLVNKMVSMRQDRASFYYRPDINQRQMEVALQEASMDIPEASPLLENKIVSMRQDRASFFYRPDNNQGEMEVALQEASMDIPEASSSASQAKSKIVTCDRNMQNLPSTKVGGKGMCDVTFENWGKIQRHVKIKSCNEPFSVQPKSIELEPGAKEKLTVLFKPKELKHYSDVIVFEVEETKQELTIKVFGKCI